MERIKEVNLYIWFGMDNLFCLDLKKLLLSKLSKVKPELEKALSLRDVVGSDRYPSRMGLFVMDSQLHFLGGENISLWTGYHRVRFNQEVFSVNLPSFSPDLSTRYPRHSGNKCRPIVFTISNKVYALSTIPLARNLENIFEVFEPDFKKWRSLPMPPFPVMYSIRSHCVFQNNLLITTYYGDYIFNTELENWVPFDKFEGSKICALLEYKDHILVLTKDPFKLVAYEMDSFYSSSAGVQLHLEEPYFSELKISWASFDIIENNYICLVFFSTHNIHVSVFRFVTKDARYGTYAFIEAYQEFDIPRNCDPDYFPFYSTFVWCTKDDEENEVTATAISQLDTNRDRYLYISLGYDNLFSLNFNDLCSEEPKLDLKLLHTHYKSGADFPIGMGLFFSDSKLHFFGGENLEEGKYQFSDYRLEQFQQLQMFAGLDNNVRPKYGPQRHGSKNKFRITCGEEWGNKKVFSFNLFPDFTRANNSNSTLIPSHSSFKFRPLVFTISNKVYALSRGPVSIYFSSIDGDDKEVKLFEVYDLVGKKWHDLKEPHPDLCKLIRNNALCIISQFVFRNKLLLQTNRGGDYLFTPSGDSGKWDRVDGKFPSIWAGVEYNDKFLLVLTKPQKELVAYELASFGEENSTSTPPTKLFIYNNVLDASYIREGASLQLVDDNLINLVYVSSFDKKIHVMLLKVDLPLRHAVLEVYRAIDIPKEYHEFYLGLGLNSIFLWQSDVIQHDDTKARDPREKKRIQHDTE